MVTLRDVARAAGVSPATASRALAQPTRVSAERRERVERAAAELGYQADRPSTDLAASADASRRGGTIGLVVPDMQNPFFAGIAKGVQDRAHSAGLSVVLADSDEDPRLELEILHRLAGQVEGIVVASPRMSDQALAALPSSPEMVLVNRESEQLRSVVIANEDGIRQAVEHLYALGHRRIAYAGGQWGSWSDRQRRRGLETVAHTLPDVELVQLGHFPTVFAGGVAAADLVSASGATAVVAHNDLIGLGIIDRLRARGTSVPGQVSVVGFDDIPGATQVSPTLTTVAVPLRRLGRTAVDLLLGPHDAAEDGHMGRTQVMAVSLVVRDSTGPAADRADARPDARDGTR